MDDGVNENCVSWMYSCGAQKGSFWSSSKSCWCCIKQVSRTEPLLIPYLPFGYDPLSTRSYLASQFFTLLNFHLHLALSGSTLSPPSIPLLHTLLCTWHIAFPSDCRSDWNGWCWKFMSFEYFWVAHILLGYRKSVASLSTWEGYRCPPWCCYCSYFWFTHL